MTHWFEDNSKTIGRTPLVRLNRITEGAGATVLAKIEGRNPAYSVKCRIGAAMVWDAEKKGLLGPGKEIVERGSRHADAADLDAAVQLDDSGPAVVIDQPVLGRGAARGHHLVHVVVGSPFNREGFGGHGVILLTA